MGRESMMLVPAFAGADDDEFEGGEAYLGEDDFEGDDDFEGEDDFEGDDADAEALEIGRAMMNARGFRRGGKRLRRCRQARHALAEQGDEGAVEGDGFGYAGPRRVARIQNRISRNQRRLSRVAPPAPRRQVPVRSTQINLSATGSAGEIGTSHELEADTYLDNVVFNDSSAGAMLTRVEAGDIILWKTETESGVPCSAFTTSSIQPFSLAGVKLRKGTKLVIRGKIAADNDKINALFFAKKVVTSIGC
jgi:hypothetical protein